MYLCDREIIDLASEGMITPFHPESVKKIKSVSGDDIKAISLGLSSFGYDVSLDKLALIKADPQTDIINPKNFDPDVLQHLEVLRDAEFGNYYILPPYTYALGTTVEGFDIPDDILVVAIGKSTYCRSGIIVNISPIEPGFRCASITLEIYNPLNTPVMIYQGEGIAQFLFARGTPCNKAYSARSGKYQNQGKDITVSRV